MKETPTPTEVSGEGKLYARSRGCAFESKHTETECEFGFDSNSGGSCIFSPLPKVQPHRLTQLASLKIVSMQELRKDWGRGHCSRPTSSRTEQWTFV